MNKGKEEEIWSEWLDFNQSNITSATPQVYLRYMRV